MGSTRRALVVGIAAAALVAGCSSSKSKTSSTTAAPATTAAAAAGATTTAAPAANVACSPGASSSSVKIGLINWISGNPAYAGFFQPGTAGAQARVAAQNAAGGVNGRQITIDVGDDGGDTTMNLATARRLVESDNVFGIIEFPPSGQGSGAYLEQQGVPVVGWETSGDPWALRKNFFAYAGSGALDPEKTPTSTNAEFLKAHGVTNVALFAGPPPAAIAVSKADAEGAKSIGMPVGFEDLNIAPGTGDFTADVAKTKAAGSDGFITELDALTAQGLLKAFAQAGMKEVGLFSTGYDQRVVNAFSANLQGDFFGTEFAPLELNLPGHQQYKADMAKYQPSALIGQMSLIGWLSADLFIKGLQLLGSECPNRAEYIKALQGLHDYTGQGLLPSIDFATQQGKPKICIFYSQVQGKAFVPVSDKPFCGKAVTPSQ
jgi:branched-chain amino acid transport system substrate-binding protein